jgi:protein-S-isoprenylcysteine O-methyltransferase Ste14
MHLAFDIFQGIGVAAAVGVRPFLPSLVVGALAAGDVEIEFTHSDYSFLQHAPFLAAVAVAAIVLAMLERRFKVDEPPLALALGAASGALAALLFAGALSHPHHTAWPGWIAGPLCALVAVAATRPLLARVRARLAESTGAALPLYAEGLAVAIAFLSVVAPPIGVIVLAALLWLLVAGRRRSDKKYAGLRILR